MAFTKPGHPAAFSGPTRLRKESKNTLSIKEALKTAQSYGFYSLHKQFKKPRITNPFITHYKRQQIQLDLIDVTKLATENDGKRFLLTGIDVFTKFAVVVPTASKSGNDMSKAIEILLARFEDLPEKIVCDRGLEFRNKNVRKILEEKAISMYHPNGEHKAAVVERFNRTILDLLYRYMEHSGSKRYINVLSKLVKTYNSRGHRTLKGLSPLKAELPHNQKRVRSRLYDYFSRALQPSKTPKFKVGDKVRVRLLRTKFERGYQRKYSTEVFSVKSVKKNLLIPMFELQDSSLERIVGYFYPEELSKIKE